MCSITFQKIICWRIVQVTFISYVLKLPVQVTCLSHLLKVTVVSHNMMLPFQVVLRSYLRTSTFFFRLPLVRVTLALIYSLRTALYLLFLCADTWNTSGPCPSFRTPGTVFFASNIQWQLDDDGHDSGAKGSRADPTDQAELFEGKNIFRVLEAKGIFRNLLWIK